MQGEYRTIPIDQIRPGRYQARIDFDPEALEQMAASMRRDNLLQPVVVRAIAPQQFELVAGERRWRAAGLAQLHEIPAIVRTISDDVAQELALLENIQREDLSPIELARGMRRLLDERQLNQEDLAEILSMQRATIAHHLRLLELPDEVQQFVHSGQLTAGHGKALAGLPQRNQQLVIARRLVRSPMTVRALEAEVQRLRELDQRARDPATARQEPNVASLTRSLQDRFQTDVKLDQPSGKRRHGELRIVWHSLEELQGILHKLGIEDEPPPKG